ncbi:hypothetical protein F0L74_14055 [Chitinophaga agrisoli]|uniref:Uncharacterized protein n=1 Tax=Chitinophaga agrisoli TaxID=2607653 RepID=A0A5B2VZC7_9BACT|nr:SxtJ family membrane protein [Chitinophaga agrisoli]KAA2243606.1 hypothetical protein F0L74_14055 [Chitinophaga agrisoli]
MIKKLYTAWVKFGELLGAVNSRIILGIVFCLVVVPVACCRRLARKDPLQLRQFKKGRGSVMQPRDHTFTREDLLHTF